MSKHQTEDFFARIGETIARFRKEAKLTQGELAQTIGVTQQNFALYETGQRRIPLPTLLKISETLNISLDELIPQQQQTRRRGPAPKILRQLERVQALPEDKQKLISDLIDSLAGPKQD